MILTVKEKIELLEKVKESLFKEIHMNMYSFGICGYIRVRTGCSIKDSIPELLKHKPINAGMFWFDMDKAGHGKRIEIINKTISDIEYENENFEMEIPDLSVLRGGYYVSSLDGYYTCQYTHSDERLFGCYKTGNWFATEKQAAKELELRKTKMFVNKLIEWCDETSMIGYNEVYVKNSSRYGIYCYDGIIKSCCLSNCNYDFRICLKSYESAGLFIKQISLPKNETHRSNLIQILKSGKL